ncbi:MAG: type II toxin-antitoxin system VapB family antitoxin [Spirochaetia bacterium]|jgi:hypothetical protein|nr:type II toxin-antitoxin system VapB family antitoxin [Spirochaetia bacterium]
MDTNLTINGTLLEKAFHVGGLQTEDETVNLALEEFIKRRAVEDIISLFNTVEYDEEYDYKKLRREK